MALKTAPVVEFSNLDHVSEPLAIPMPSSRILDPPKPASFAVIGHRGSGMNFPSYTVVRENSILSFNEASRFQIPFVEFDVQVTCDGVPVVFHDVFILTRALGTVSERRVADLSLEEFLSYGIQRDPSLAGKPLLRRSADGQIFDWAVENDDPLCTLEDVFQCVDHRLGFNIELKFDDDFDYRDEELSRTVEIILQSVHANARGRQIIFSTFHPDSAMILRQKQQDYPVYFLTNCGKVIHKDVRRNSLEEAANLCVKNRLNGIVSETRAVLKDPAAVAGIKEKNLHLLTYGALNNVEEVVYMQHMMGIDGVIVDRVQEISEIAGAFVVLQDSDGEGGRGTGVGAKFSEGQLSFLRKLVAKLLV